jgi:hypothetical protein
VNLRAHATSIALVIAAIGAVAYAYVDRDHVTESEKKSRASNVFSAWRREELTRIEIDHDGESIVLERTKDDAGDPVWRMRAPFDHEKANQEAVDKLASVLEFANVVRKVDAATPPSATKLDAPRAHGEIAMGALVYRFALGGDAPTPEGAAYLRVDDLGAVVVTRDVVNALLQKSDAYRSRSIVPYLSIELAKLEVKSDAGTVTIARVDDVSFTLANGLRASRSKLDRVWGALAEMRAEAFVSDAVAAPLVASPRVTVTMTPKDGARAAGVLRVGGACPGNDADLVVTRDAPTKLAACAPKGVLEGLTTSDPALVDTRLFAAHDDEIAELRIEALPLRGSSAAIELARKESAWREKAPVESDLSGEDAEAASALVAAIARTEGIDPQKSDAPFTAAARVTIHRADNDVVEVIDVGAPDANGDVVVRRAFDGARLHVAAAFARKLVPSAIALRGKELWSPRIEGAPVTAIETHCDGVDQRATHDGDVWTMRAPAGYGVDNATVLDAIDTVTRARVESWVADSDDGHFGLGGQASCTIALDVAGDAGTRAMRIELGREGEGGVYARTSDAPAIFVAPKALRDRARTWLIDLHGLAPPEVASVTLDRNGKHLTFAGDAGDDATDAVLRAANVLRADSVVHLGAALADEGFAHPSLVATIHGKTSAKRVTFGRESSTNDAKTVFARVDGLDATFALDRDRAKPFYDAF